MDSRLYDIYHQFDHKLQPYKNWLPALFFLAGFLFDTITLGRIDSFWTIFQQAITLLIIGHFLYVDTLHRKNPWTKNKYGSKIWEHRTQIVQFLFGTLLNAYTIFYFKSSSFFSSLLYVLILSTLMILNEWPKFQKLGIGIKWSLFSLCTISYFSYLTPMMIGSMGPFTLLLALGFTFSITTAIGLKLKKGNSQFQVITSQFIVPSSISILIFSSLYFLKVIPPVPLSLDTIGIYHDLKKTKDNHYLTYHERPFWKIWHNGDQEFLAQPDDQIYCVARIFSPTNFKDQIVFHWLFKDPTQGWLTTDRIPTKILGGRAQGFRTFSKKNHYEVGQWQVKIETLSEREIGRIYFEVFSSPKKDRKFKESQI